jgi:NAD(P)-dependent dehydrogenase (short-subunit alcohol dehydrogenase family)
VCVDVRNQQSCERLARESAAHLGEIDFLVSCVGGAQLRPIAETTLEDWHWSIETNALGFHQVLRACLPVMAPYAMAAALSSDAADQNRAALGAYATSKVALERALQAWRSEHQGLRVCRIRVGQTWPTDFGKDFDGEILDKAFAAWAASGLSVARYMTPDEVAGAIAGLLSVAAAYPSIALEELTIVPSAAASSFFEPGEAAVAPAP